MSKSRRNRVKSPSALAVSEEPRSVKGLAALPQTSSERRRRWIFRGLALVSPLLLVALLELGLRLCGWGYPSSFFLSAREGGRSFLIENASFARRFFPASVARTPQPVVLTAKKPPGTLRVVVFGESAAMGDPEPSYGLARQLQCLLEARYPDKRVEVVNAAMTAIDSEVMLQIAQDAAHLESDYWVVYAGNNEVIGPFGAGSIFGARQVPRLLLDFIVRIKATRVWQLVDGLSQRRRERSEWQGMEAFLGLQVPLGDPRLNVLYSKLSENLARVIRLGSRSGAQVILSTMPVNLKDCPPFASGHRPGLSDAELAAWEEHFARGERQQNAGRMDEALKEFQLAAKIDAQYAELLYRIADCERRMGGYDRSRQDFELARDLDTLRFRADSRIRKVILQAAQMSSVTLVDAEALCARESAENLPGAEVFVDHVHLKFRGNFIVAGALAEAVCAAEHTRVSPQEKAMGVQEVALRLAFTEFDERRVAEEMRMRLRQPPFRQQSNFQARDEEWGKLVQRLKAAPREGVSPYELALRQSPEDWVLHANFARLLEAAGNPGAAAAQWEEVSRLVPHYPEAWLNRSSVLGTLGHFREAEQLGQEALKRGADPADVFNELGLQASTRGEHRLAERYFTRALRLRPGASVVRLNLAAELADLGDFTGATNQYSEIIRRDPNNIGARDNFGSLLLRQGEEDTALRLFQEALRMDPDHSQTHYNLGRLFTKRGQHAEAVREYESAVRARPDFAQAQLGLALELAASGREAEALERFAEAARLAPDWVDARFNYGISLAKARRYLEAAQELEAAVKLQPSHVSAQKALERARELARTSGQS